MSVPWLTLLWLVPALGAAGVLAIGRRAVESAKVVGLVVAGVVLALSVGLAVTFVPGGDRYQFVEDHSWIPALGTRYALGVDGIGLVLVLLTAVLVPLVLIAGWRDADHTGSLDGAGGRTPKGPHTYVALTLAVESMVLISFVSLDVLLFYIVFEAMLIPMYFLIGGFGNGAGAGAGSAASGPNQYGVGSADVAGRSAAAVKFLLYNLFGGLVMLAAVVGLYVITDRSGLGESGGGTFSLRTITDAVAEGRLDADSGVAKLLFLGFMFAFAVKAPLWPLHSWLPDAAVSSTPSTAVLMMAVVDKVGTFAMLRYCLQLFPDASRWFAPLIVALAVIGIVYGAILAIGQSDLMRLISYTSISHFGFIILGIFALSAQGMTGSTLYMVNHGISTAALFLVAGFLVSRRGSRLIADYGGVQRLAPVLSGTFLIAGLATLSLPGLAPFVSEFLVFIGTFGRYPVAAVVATSALVLSALYVLWTYQRVMGGPVPDEPGDATASSGSPDGGATVDPSRAVRAAVIAEGTITGGTIAVGTTAVTTADRRAAPTMRDRITDLVPRELAVVVPLIALLIVLGVYPKPMLDLIDPAVGHTMSTIHQQDQPPQVEGGTR